MEEDTRPFASDYDQDARGDRCPCDCLSFVKNTRQKLQRQRGCGCVGYSPPWMQRLADIRVFVCVICMYWLLFTTLQYYLVAVITTIEKRFGYSSARSGLLLSIPEVAYVVMVTFVSHFARNFHRPRFVALSGVVGAIGGLVFALPHFVYDRRHLVLVGGGAAQLDPTNVLCGALPPLVAVGGRHNLTRCDLEPESGVHGGSYALFALGSVIIGIGLTPMTALSLTYVDDAVGPKRASLLIGFMNMMRPLGPVLGFFLGGIFTSKYETLEDPGFDQMDPRWVGAWWIGYLLIPCLLLLPVIFLPMFPQKIPRDPVKDADYVTPTNESGGGGQISIQQRRIIVQVPHSGTISINDFCSSLCELLRNPVYMCLQLGGCLSAFVISGLFPFIPKYMEVMFHLTASFANIISGIVSALMAALGVLGGGILSSYFKWTPKQMAIFILFMDGLFAMFILFMLLIHCPDIHLVKTTPTNSTCLDMCHCLPDHYHPVCGDNHYTYLSPCEAGCSRSHSNNTWSQCACVSPEGGSVKSGVCDHSCKSWIPFAIILAVGAFILMMTSVPGTNICLRGVKEKHRAIAFGFSGTLLAFASFVPGPMIYGAIIDSTCIVWRETCGRKEECLLYDEYSFRTRSMGATFGFKVIAGIFYFALYILLKRKETRKLMDGTAEEVRYYGGNSMRVESPTFSDGHEVQLRI